MLGTHGWQKQEIEFTAPKDCHAVVVRLHRRPSHRFDSKIAGRLWLDDFRLEKDQSMTKHKKAKIRILTFNKFIELRMLNLD